MIKSKISPFVISFIVWYLIWAFIDWDILIFMENLKTHFGRAGILFYIGISTVTGSIIKESKKDIDDCL